MRDHPIFHLDTAYPRPEQEGTRTVEEVFTAMRDFADRMDAHRRDDDTYPLDLAAMIYLRAIETMAGRALRRVEGWHDEHVDRGEVRA